VGGVLTASVQRLFQLEPHAGNFRLEAQRVVEAEMPVDARGASETATTPSAQSLHELGYLEDEAPSAVDVAISICSRESRTACASST
jgi:hypothetical protein